MRLTDTMLQFVNSRGAERMLDYHNRLVLQWATTPTGELSTTFMLLWGAASESQFSSGEAACSALIGADGRFEDCHLEGVDFARFNRLPDDVRITENLKRSFRRATLVECRFDRMDLGHCTFEGAWLESVSFRGANLKELSFKGASLLDVDLTDAIVTNTDFRAVEAGMSIRLGGIELDGDRARGALAALGAVVGEVAPIFRAMSHPSYEIAQKIARKILEPGPSQVLGLTQRGVAAKAPAIAQRFIQVLESAAMVRADRAGAEKVVVETTEGRKALRSFVEETALPSEFNTFFDL